MRNTNEMCNEAFASLDLESKRWLIEIANEVKRAKEKHPKAPKDINHMALIMMEEAGEVARACVQFTYEGGKFFEIHKELIQTGAMVVRMATMFSPPEGEEVFTEFIESVRKASTSEQVIS
jgi:NTP pyrophosphatase (non-canonical NTP hydrolase)